jgi:hypothetical protein
MDNPREVSSHELVMMFGSRSGYIFLASVLSIPILAIALRFTTGETNEILSSFPVTISIYWSIFFLRLFYARHVYTLWYLFFLITYCGFGIYMYLDSINLIAPDNFGGFEVIKSSDTGFLAKWLTWYLEISTDRKGEFVFLLSLLGLVIIPQILSFLFSGAFGCGKPPIFVSIITKFAILSFIKFLCVLSALQLSSYLFMIYMHSDKITSITYINLSTTFGLLCASFWISLIYYMSHRTLLLILTLPGASDSPVFKFLNSIWLHMTRFTAREAQPES